MKDALQLVISMSSKACNRTQLIHSQSEIGVAKTQNHRVEFPKSYLPEVLRTAWSNPCSSCLLLCWILWSCVAEQYTCRRGIQLSRSIRTTSCTLILGFTFMTRWPTLIQKNNLSEWIPRQKKLRFRLKLSRLLSWLVDKQRNLESSRHLKRMERDLWK